MSLEARLYRFSIQMRPSSKDPGLIINSGQTLFYSLANLCPRVTRQIAYSLKKHTLTRFIDSMIGQQSSRECFCGVAPVLQLKEYPDTGKLYPDAQK